MLAVTSFVPISARGRPRRDASSGQGFALPRQTQTAHGEKRYAAAAKAYRQLLELCPYDDVLHSQSRQVRSPNFIPGK